MKKLIVIANLGKIRVLRITEPEGPDGVPETRRLVNRRHLSEEETINPEGGSVSRISDTVTDQAGRFAQGSSAGTEGGMSYGERHNLESEIERDAIRKTTAAIDAALAKHEHDFWVLAAPKPVIKQIESGLAAANRETLVETHAVDLTKRPVKDLEERFL